MNHFTPFIDTTVRRPLDLGTYVKLRIEQREAEFSAVQLLLLFIVVAALLAYASLQVAS